MKLSGRQMIAIRLNNLRPGKTITFAYTVRVPTQATHDLNIVTTPMINADGISTGSNGKVESLCADDSGSSSDGSSPSEEPSSSSSTDGSLGGLDLLDKLRQSASCPVDLRKTVL